MEQHMDILMVLAALGGALVVFFLVKFFAKNNNDATIDGGEQADPGLGNLDTLYEDQIVAVRKTSELNESMEEASIAEAIGTLEENGADVAGKNEAGKVIAIFIMAKQDQAFKGYELLQALLSQGLRFGDMSIFHRYPNTHGKGEALFSLTSAVEPGTFDIHNMGSYSTAGLTLFMQTSGQSKGDVERFELMLKAASNLAKELDGTCLDQSRQPLTNATLENYKQLLYTAPELDSAVG